MDQCCQLLTHGGRAQQVLAVGDPHDGGGPLRSIRPVGQAYCIKLHLGKGNFKKPVPPFASAGAFVIVEIAPFDEGICFALFA